MGPPKQFKIVIVGDPCVGKTCLLTLFTHGICKRHLDHYIPTTGVDFSPKSLEIDGESYMFTFGDVAGNSRKRSTPKPPPYYKGVHGVVIVYDSTNEKSFENVSDLWLKDINTHSDKENVQKILVANKSDMTRSVDRSKGEDLAEDEEIPFYETSASTAANVDEAFLSIARAIRMKFDPKEGLPPLRLPMSRGMTSRTPSSSFMTSRLRTQGRLSSSRYIRSISIGSSVGSFSNDAKSIYAIPTDVSTSTTTMETTLRNRDPALGLLLRDKKSLNSSDSPEPPKSKMCSIL